MRLPEYLIEEIAARRVVFFLGAGASAASVSEDGKSRPPQWDELLRQLRSRVGSKAVRSVVTRLMEAQDYLGAAEVLVDSIPAPDFHAMLTELIQRPAFGENALVRAIHDLDPKIVISTNYDLVYESLCSEEIRKGFMRVKHYTDADIVDSIRSEVRLYIYAHGCIKSPSEAILSTSQYYAAKRKNPGFFHILESIFMTHTVVFVGYSLRDPDIQLVFEANSLKALSSRKHMLIVEKGNPEAILRSMKARYDLQVYEYPKGKHEVIPRYFSNILEQVEQRRQRGV